MSKQVFGIPGQTGQTVGNNLNNNFNELYSRAYFCSQNGMISDAVLDKGSSTFGTNQTAAFQSILDLASSTNPITVVVDVKFSIGSKLLMDINTKIIILPGCGWIARDGSNCTMLSNKNQTASTTHTTKNLEIYAYGGILNHNRAGNSSHNTLADGWLCPIRFTGVDGITIKGLKVIDQQTFAIHIMNCNDIDVDQTYMDPNVSFLVHTDGVHFNGPCDNLSVTRSSFGQGDDAVACNANDVFQSSSSGVQSYDPYATNGAITNVVINHNTLRTGHGVRLLSTVDLIDNVYAGNWKGVINQRLFLADNWQGGTPSVTGGGNFGSNIVFDCAGVKMNFTAPVFILGGQHKRLIFKNIVRDNTGYANASVTFDFESNFDIDELVIDGFHLIAPVANSPAISTGGRVGRFIINNAMTSGMPKSGAITGTPLIKFNSTYHGRIQNLQLSNIHWEGCTSLIDNTVGQLDFVQGDNINFTYINAGLSAIVVGTGKKINDITLNNYTSGTPFVGGAGSYPALRGSGFSSQLSGSIAQTQLGTFTAADGTLLSAYAEPVVGSTFSVQNSCDFQILSNVLVPTGATPSGNLWYAVNNINVVDHEAEIQIKVTTSGAVAQVYVRWTNSTNYVLVSLSSTIGSCSMANVVAGVSTGFGTVSAAAPFTDLAFHRIRVNAVGTSLNVYFDERLIMFGTIPSTQTGTRAGFGCISASAPTVFSFDNYRGYNATYSGSPTAASAKLDLQSTTQGFLLPRMTKAQRDAISSPATGLSVWQTDNTPGLRSFNGTNWMRFTETID